MCIQIFLSLMCNDLELNFAVVGLIYLDRSKSRPPGKFYYLVPLLEKMYILIYLIQYIVSRTGLIV